MANVPGVEDADVADQDVAEVEENAGVAEEKHWAEKRLGQETAKKKALEAQLAQKDRELEEVKAAMANKESDHVEAADYAEDQAYFEKTVVGPVRQVIDSEYGPLLEDHRRDKFWKDRAHVPEDLKSEVELAVDTLRNAGHRNIDRQAVYHALLGQKVDAETTASEAEAAHKAALLGEVNDVAAGESGPSAPEPEQKQKSFDEMTPSEKFKALSEDGAFGGR